MRTAFECLTDPFGCALRGAFGLLPWWAWAALALCALLFFVGATYSLVQLIRKIAGLPGVIAFWGAAATLLVVFATTLRKALRRPAPEPIPVERPLPRRRRKRVVPLTERIKGMFTPR